MHLVQHIRKGETTPMSIRRLAVLCTAMLCAGMLVLCRVFWIAADQSYAASAAAQTVSETVLPIRRGNYGRLRLLIDRINEAPSRTYTPAPHA